MKKRQLVGMLTAVTLLASLITGTVVSRAQTSAPLTEYYTWQPYNVIVAYPIDWTVVEKDQRISVHPADRDVSDGFGPELVLFEVPDTPGSKLDSALESIASDAGAQHGDISSASYWGYPARSTSLTWDSPASQGHLLLFAAGENRTIGLAYIVRQADRADYLPVLNEISDSLVVGSTVMARSGSSSYSVASVQLPQPYMWDSAGLVLHFPADWTISQDEVDPAFVGPAVVAEAPVSPPYRSAQAVILNSLSSLDLHDMAAIAAKVYGTPSSPTDVTVAGYPGVVYDIVDTESTPTSKLRSLTLDITDQQKVAMVVLGTDLTDWDTFRPVASAFISSIERADASTAALSFGDGRTPVARAQPEPFSPPQQDTPQPSTYLWEEYGVTFSVPDGWNEIRGGQNFDLALVSPEALNSGAGAYLTFRVFASLGVDTTMESALKGLESQVDGTEEAYSVAGLDGAHVPFSDDQAGTVNQLILLPYGEGAAVLYVQTTAPKDNAGAIDDILNSMVIDPPKPDYAAADAAWQASLAADGTLTYGSPDAPVRMIEYLSFTCPHCADYMLPIEHLSVLEAATGRVQMQWAPIAGDDLAKLATETTYCAAAQGKGFSSYEALFNGFLTLGPDAAYTQDGIDGLLEPLGVDLDALHACVDAKTHQSIMDQVDQDFLDAGLSGTPTIMLAKGSDPFDTLKFPDGSVWSGTVPIEVLRDILKSIIDEDMAIADAVTAYFSG